MGMMDGRSNFPTLLIGGENFDICSESLNFSSYCSLNICTNGFSVAANIFSLTLPVAMKRKMSTGACQNGPRQADRVQGLQPLGVGADQPRPAGQPELALLGDAELLGLRPGHAHRPDHPPVPAEQG